MSYGPLHIPSQACKDTQQRNSDDHGLSADGTGKRKASTAMTAHYQRMVKPVFREPVAIIFFLGSVLVRVQLAQKLTVRVGFRKKILVWFRFDSTPGYKTAWSVFFRALPTNPSLRYLLKGKQPIKSDKLPNASASTLWRPLLNTGHCMLQL